MPAILPLGICYLCAGEAQTQNLGSSFLVDCQHCSSYEIETVATTIKLMDTQELLAYLDKERIAGRGLPLIFREFLIR